MADVLSSIPFYGAYNQRRAQIADEGMDAIKMLGAAQQIRASQLQYDKAMREEEMVQARRRAAAESGGDPQKYMAALLRLGAVSPTDALEFQEKQAKLRTAEDKRQYFSPENRARFIETPSEAPPITHDEEGNAYPQVEGQPRFNMGRFVEEGASRGVIDPEKYMDHLGRREDKQMQIAAQVQQARERIQGQIEVARINGASREQIAQMMQEGRREIAELAGQTQRQVAQIGAEARRDVANLSAANAPLSPIADSQSPTGYRYATRGEARGQPAPSPFASNLGNYERNVSNDFEKHPVVKRYMELVPEVEVVTSYMARRPQVPPAQRAVYDKNLVNAFMRVTHPKGDQISNFERKDLAGLPALPDRIVRAVEGFFTGAYVPDDVAKEMAQMVTDKTTALRTQVADIENKTVEDVRRRGGNVNVIRRVTRGADVPRIASDAEFNALPSGTEFIGPDGVKRRKP